MSLLPVNRTVWLRFRRTGRRGASIWDRISIKDGTIAVKFKAISGAVDQGAGLVWRYLDANNYYIVRANALEDNVVLYKVPKQAWSLLSVDFHGNLFTVTLDSQKLFDVEDSTFTEAGKTGLWTKADTVIYFDDFQVIEQVRK